MKTFVFLFFALAIASGLDVYQPCNRRIVVLFDRSNSLTNVQYETLKILLNNQVFSDFNHLERLSVGTYANFPNIHEFGTFQTLDDVQTFVNQTEQTLSQSSIRRALSLLAYVFGSLETEAETTILVFVGQLSVTDVSDSLNSAELIKKSARLSFVGLKDTISNDNLNQLADFSYILDLDKPIPADLQSVLNQAYGCN